MRRSNALIWGIVLLLVGGVLLLGQTPLLDLSSRMNWPIILLALGVVFHLYYFIGRDHNEGMLVPGGILLVYGAMFLLAEITPAKMNDLWPMFILGPAFGLFELYAFSLGRRGSMVPVFILTAIGGSFLLRNLGVVQDFRILLAVLALCLGAGLMISSFTKGARKSSQQPPAAQAPFEAREEPKAEPAQAKGEPSWEAKPDEAEAGPASEDEPRP